MTALAVLIAEGSAALAAAGIEAPRAEARLLLEAATGVSRTEQVRAPEAPITEPRAGAYRQLVARRAAREPMAYLRGRAEFWSLELAIGPGVLVPRADTETLIEAAIRALPHRAAAWRCLDLGVGSGCLILALLRHFPHARGVGTDVSAAALACTAANARRLGSAARLDLVRTSWADGVAGTFDLVVANPPYIPTAEIASLQPEVARFEPRAALDGGADGLSAYRAILVDLPRLLAPQGTCLLEIGLGQEDALVPLAAARGFSTILHRDLAGIIRCLELRPMLAA